MSLNPTYNSFNITHTHKDFVPYICALNLLQCQETANTVKQLKCELQMAGQGSIWILKSNFSAGSEDWSSLSARCHILQPLEHFPVLVWYEALPFPAPALLHRQGHRSLAHMSHLDSFTLLFQQWDTWATSLWSSSNMRPRRPRAFKSEAISSLQAETPSWSSWFRPGPAIACLMFATRLTAVEKFQRVRILSEETLVEIFIRRKKKEKKWLLLVCQMFNLYILETVWCSHSSKCCSLSIDVVFACHKVVCHVENESIFNLFKQKLGQGIYLVRLNCHIVCCHQ